MAEPDYQEIDREMEEAYEFAERSVRHAFIRKVYAILMSQLLLTFGIIALFVFWEPLGTWTRQHPLFVAMVGILTIVLLIALICCEDVRRTFPTNFICLFLFTIAEGILLGVTASYYSEDIVLLAVGITVVVCFSVTVFAFQTKIDVTGMGLYLFVGFIVLAVLGILTIFLYFIFPGYIRIINIVYASLGALLFSCYLVFDTQLILGGKHKYSISPHEYIFASLNIYLDIVQIFICILRIVGGGRN